MSDHVPAPKFDTQNYVRPNDRYICGHAAEGKSCPLGPDQRGRCQATAECVPSLATQPGEKKGRWVCNRAGEKCETGPLPDGTCCRPIQRCSPLPTLRTVRGRFNLGVITFTCAALLLLLGKPAVRDEFINPGPLSSAHALRPAGPSHGQTNSFSCASCHDAGNAGPPGIVNAALSASPAPWQWTALLRTNTAAATRMDAACEKCHALHDFHQPNVSRDVGCAFCHQEHQGTGRMAKVNDQECGICHGQRAVMAAARAKGSEIPPQNFPLPRPRDGFTEVIHSFSKDHPEFLAIRSGAHDPDSLKFNHKLHLTAPTVPELPNHQKLNCAFCHQPDASGAFIRPVNFERNCRVCHSLQFDTDTPELQLPHGSVSSVSAFLHSLPEQYSEIAQKQGITDNAGRRQFAESKLAGLRDQIGLGEDLEARVFFSTATAGPVARSATIDGASRAVFSGCVYCHEVKHSSTESAIVTKPVLTERWFPHAQFQHGKHTAIACTVCHDAPHSSQTSDVLLPSKTECVRCHSESGGAPNSCVNCHAYHHNPPLREAAGLARK